MGKLSGKFAVVTGGSSGIGLATAKRFIEEGAQVIIFGRNAKEVTNACESTGSGMYGVVGDVSKLEDLDKLFATVKEKFGKLDIVFANAGGGDPASFFDMTEKGFDSIFDVNVKGVYFTIQKALPLLRDGSSLILTSSAMHAKGLMGLSAYNASKAAVRSLARSWSSELRERKIRVNAMSPGITKTPIFGKSGMSDDQVSEMEKQFIPQIPLGRFGLPQETAAAVLFLASDESSYITGTDLYVDGGFAQI